MCDSSDSHPSGPVPCLARTSAPVLAPGTPRIFGERRPRRERAAAFANTRSSLRRERFQLPASPASGLSRPVLLEPRLADSGLAAPTNSFHFPRLDASLRAASCEADWLPSESGLEPETLPSPSSKARSSACRDTTASGASGSWASPRERPRLPDTRGERTKSCSHQATVLAAKKTEHEFPNSH